MGHVDVSGINYTLSDGQILLSDITFRVGDGAKAALVGPNGAGKTTLMRLIAGDISAESGTISRSGGLGVMRQFIGSVRDQSTVRDLLISVAPETIRKAANALDQSETSMMEIDDEKSQLAYAQALSDWADIGGYDWEVLWDFCCTAAISAPFDEVRYRQVNTLSGGEQKRVVLEALLRGPDEVLLLDEPDNYLDVPGKRWLEASIKNSTKTIFFVSHDRELLSHTANRIITVEEGAAGSTAWTHGSNFESWHQARRARNERMAELLRRWEEEHQRLKDLVRTLQQQAANSPDMASKYQAMQTRLRKFEDAGPPETPPPKQTVRMK
jgi:ATPase subunit of ABC transporter with duplicated ATPase domains